MTGIPNWIRRIQTLLIAVATAITLGEGATALAGGKGAGTAAIGNAEAQAVKEVTSMEAATALGPRRPSMLQRDRVFDKGKDSSGVPRCEYCGNEITRQAGKPNSYEADHIKPYSRGGPTIDENLAPSCRTCNRRKGSKTPEEFQSP